MEKRTWTSKQGIYYCGEYRIYRQMVLDLFGGCGLKNTGYWEIMRKGSTIKGSARRTLKAAKAYAEVLMSRD